MSLADVVSYAPEPAGLLPARAAIAAYYRDHAIDVDPAQIIVTASTSEAYSHLFRLLADPGDSVLTPQPSYPLFDYLAALDGLHVAPYRLVYDNSWRIDLVSVQKAISPHTRAMILVNPNNPTGSYIAPAELVAAKNICRHRVPLIVDEVFLDYDLCDTGANRRSLCGDHEDVTFILSGLSKVAALPQMKLSWIVVCGPRPPRERAVAALELINDMYLSASIPVQAAAPTLLAARHAIQSAIRTRLQANLDMLDRALAATAATRRGVQGGWSAVIDLPPVRSDEGWVLHILDNENVTFHPGFLYDFEDDPVVVCSLLTPPADFEHGIQALTRCLPASSPQ